MPDRGPRKKPAAESPDIPLVGAGVAPVAGHDDRPPDASEGAPERKRKFQKRLAQKVDQSLTEHPDGSAPPLDRLTQDLDPSTDL
ncbi:MAG: hypothetical protein C5B56_05825 [Proteobacteria bacterium]|nr:MAG: hypothetical protein C5B56_05825 [Pseudomonadota bacterium]